MSKETKEPISNAKIYIRYVVHMLLTIIFAAGVAWFSNEVILEKAWNTLYFQYAGILLAVIALCSLLERKKLYRTLRSIGIQMAGFLVSALLLLLSDYYVNLPIWLLGGIVVAALVNRNIGMLYLYYFVFHAIYLQGSWMNGLVFHFVVATLIAFFIPKMKTFLGMFYMMAFAACTVVTGSVLHNKMCIDEAMMLDTFYILCTYLACIFITMLLIKWTGEKNSTNEEEVIVPGNYEYLDRLAVETAEREAALEAVEKEKAAEELVAEVAVTEELSDEVVIVPEKVTEEVPLANDTEEAIEQKDVEEAVEKVAEETVEEAVEEIEEKTIEEAVEKIKEASVEEEVTEEPEEVIDYTPYCNEKSELLLELREKSKSAYAQSILVSKLASETANSIGLNVELTKAGGLYKRIGKIKETNDEYTSTEIAKEYNFPEPLIYLLDQLNHNIIEQKEAALLLITDGVISYYSIVRQVQKNDIAVEKIVDTIVSKKIFQGEFNESGLSMQECFLLREKLIALLKSQDKKNVTK